MSRTPRAATTGTVPCTIWRRTAKSCTERYRLFPFGGSRPPKLQQHVPFRAPFGGARQKGARGGTFCFISGGRGPLDGNELYRSVPHVAARRQQLHSAVPFVAVLGVRRPRPIGHTWYSFVPKVARIATEAVALGDPQAPRSATPRTIQCIVSRSIVSQFVVFRSQASRVSAPALTAPNGPQLQIPRSTANINYLAPDIAVWNHLLGYFVYWVFESEVIRIPNLAAQVARKLRSRPVYGFGSQCSSIHSMVPKHN